MPGAHDIVERLERLLDRRRVVETVNLVQVDVVGTETTQAVVDLGEDCLTGQAAAVGTRPHRAVHLCCDHDFVAFDTERLERATEKLLAGPA